jgi:hypothetical protein
VKSIVTLPALAVSELASNFSWPSASVASFSVGPAASLLAVGAAVEELELDVAGATGALDGADAEERLAGLCEQLAWLRDAGFGEVDCHFKWLELALIVAVREPSGAADE